MYETLKTALDDTGIPLAEGDWDGAPLTGSYMVLRLESEAASMWGDQHQQAQAVEGSVQLYCRTRELEDYRKVQAVLDALELSWRYNGTQYEPRNGIVHYEWLFQLEYLEAAEIN